MKFFFDTEFLETSGQGNYNLQIISIGIVAEDGRELYLENAGFDWGQKMDSWLLENIKPHLLGEGHDSWVSLAEMAQKILELVGQEPEFWAYAAASDWLALISLFGRVVDRPEGWPIFCRELKWFLMERGYSKEDMPVQEGQEHLAIADARWNLAAYQSLQA